MSDFRRKLVLLKLSRQDGVPAVIRGIDHLMIGSVGCIYHMQSLRELGVTQMLCVGDGVESPPLSVLREFNINFWNCGVKDDPDVDISAIFDQCFEIIEGCRRTHGRVLVYCFQGKSRSAAVVTAYVMKYYHMSFVSSLNLVRETRPLAEPNLGFIVTLRRLERQLKAEVGDLSSCLTDINHVNDVN